MGIFLETFKYHLVLGKLFGFIFFPIDDKNESCFVFLWIVPFAIIYFYATIKGAILIPRLFTQTVLYVEDIEFIIVSQLTSIFNVLYCFVQRRGFQRLLQKLDRFDGRLEYKTLDRKKTRLASLALTLGFLLATDATSTYFRREPVFLFALFNIGSTVFLIHQYIICEIYNKLFEQIQFINGNILTIIIRNFLQPIRSPIVSSNVLTKFIKLQKEFTNICKETNELFGFPILLNLTFSLTMLIVSTYNLKLKLFQYDFLAELGVQIWSAVTIIAVVWSIKLWTSIENEVSQNNHFDKLSIPHIYSS